MMVAVEGWLIRAGRWLSRLGAHPRLRRWAEVAACWGGGFLASAAALGGACQPMAMGLVCGCAGWRAVCVAAGGCLGYWVFWGQAGAIGMVWMVLGCLLALVMGEKKTQTPLLLPALAAFCVSLSGLVFQIAWGDETSVGIYCLRIILAGAWTGLAGIVMHRREVMADRLAVMCVLLALGQVAPIPWLGLGYIAGGLLAAGGSFPAAAMAGLGLDLAGITRIPMTAVLCGAYLVRCVPFSRRWPRYAAPAAVGAVAMALFGQWDPTLLPGLALGGLCAVLLPGRWDGIQYRGETGAAQVRLELMAGTMLGMQQLLLESRLVPIDREALLLRARERACGGCPNRKQCRDIVIPEGMLERDLMAAGELGFGCKKPGRMIQELRRTQEQYRSMGAEQARREEYRAAVGQQYAFLGEYLREQADQLSRRGYGSRARFRVEAQWASRGRELANGDCFSQFDGPLCRHYVLLCDGMGTGLGAAMEGQEASGLLKQMLTAGFPAEYALRSLNHLLILRGASGAVTVDLAQIDLETGRIALYKWGAAPSYVLRATGAEKIGTAGPPPGLAVSGARETVERLSLRRGEALIMLSDGVDPAQALRREGISPQMAPGELAHRILERTEEAADDATVAVVRISALSLTA